MSDTSWINQYLSTPRAGYTRKGIEFREGINFDIPAGVTVTHIALLDRYRRIVALQQLTEPVSFSSRGSLKHTGWTPV